VFVVLSVTSDYLGNKFIVRCRRKSSA